MDKLSFPQQHGAMLLKYSGISFISGAVNHGFFSGARSLWTAAIGMLLFVLGVWLEHRRNSPQRPQTSELLRALVWGSLLSIGLGFFTGGLQHFPDSPARSAWVVPLGFAVSVLALLRHESLPLNRAFVAYGLVLGAWVGAGSWGAYQWLLQNPQWAESGHSHADDGHGAPVVVRGTVIDRSVEIHMDDSMRFSPSALHVVAGETLRLVVHNKGQTEHELVLGTAQDIQAHAQEMKAQQDAAHSHGHAGAAAIRLGPGQVGELVVTFAQAGELQMACLLPGHYEAGMRGHVVVAAADGQSGPAAPASADVGSAAPGRAGVRSAAPRPAAHDRGSHPH